MKRLDTRRLETARLCVQSLAPEFGENYKPGFIGFWYDGSSVRSNGIAYFTRWSRLSDIHVDGALVVTGENEAIEVDTRGRVVKVDLARYFENEKRQIFFRKPRKCSALLGQRIAETAKNQEGTTLEQLQLAARILEGSFFRRWMFSELQESLAERLALSQYRQLGAELAAYCLDCQPEYADRGLLAPGSAPLTVQGFFEDGEIFASWSDLPEEGPKSNSVL